MNPDPKNDPGHNPAVLVEVTRGTIVESQHYGVVAVSDAQGNLFAWAGDPDTITYYRSACKPVQAVPLVESGGADHFGLTDSEIAVTCGSHGGEDFHIEAVLSILAKIGVGPEALACGVHEPFVKEAARQLHEWGQPATAVHNNCSGKHAGMLALARFHGWPVGGYEEPHHPVQQLMLSTIAEFAGLQPEQVAIGVDGCGVCTFGLPVQRMAASFARLGQADYWPDPRRGAILRLQHAITGHPEMVGYNHENIDTDIMRAGAGSLLSKRGAEGVYCATRIPTGGEPALGFALKLLDGDVSGRARNPAIVEGLRHAGFLNEEMLTRLESYWMEEIRNRPGDVVGMVRPAFTLISG